MMMKQQQQQQQQQSESKPSSMRKICIEVCLISARGLPRSSLWKHHWFAVGWIDPNNKYCTKIDSSGNPNPVWKTKFTCVVDLSESDFHDLALFLEVYSRDPIFLGEKLRGTATVSLKEFLAKYGNNSEGSNYGNEEVGSFQLRKKNSDKPQGFIDVSIRISEESEGPTSSYTYLGSEEGFNLNDGRNGINLATEAGPMQAYPTGHAGEPTFELQGKTRPPVHYPYMHPVPYPTNYPNPSVGGPSYPPPNRSSAYPPPPGPPRTPPPPPPPPPSNVGYIPTFLPRTDNQPTMYMNMPSSGGGAGRGAGPGFGVGLGAGALAAGAVIFGDDFMSGFQLPAGMRSDPSIIISTDPPF